MDTAMQSPEEWITVERASRIMAPAAGGLGEGRSRLRDRIVWGKIRARAALPPPSYPILDDLPALSRQWFAAILNDNSALRAAGDFGAFYRDYSAWADGGGLLLASADVAENSGPDFEPAEADALRVRGSVNWSLPLTLAWIATRDLDAVTQVSDPQAWRRPQGDDSYGVKTLDEIFIDVRRRSAIGWLVREVAEKHCQCPAAGDERMEKWQRCKCLATKMSELKAEIRAGRLRPAMVPPDYNQEDLKLDLSAFVLSPTHLLNLEFDQAAVEGIWPPSGPLGQPVLVSREDLHDWEAVVADAISRQPPPGANIPHADRSGTDDDAARAPITSTAAGITDCSAWLCAEFAKPESAAMRRQDFKGKALTRFTGRLSGRGFRSAWARAVNAYPDRKRPGPKTSA